MGKTVAIDAGKTFVEKAVKQLYTLKSQVAIVVDPLEEIGKNINKLIAEYVDTTAINLNKLIDGSSVNRPTAYNIIAIQNIVKRLNESGLKFT